MTRWRGPQGRYLDIFSGVLVILFVLPILLLPLAEYATGWGLASNVVLLAIVLAILYYMRRSHRDTWEMVFRETQMTVEEAGAAIEGALDEVWVHHGRPVRRPRRTELRARFEWEVDIPYRELRIGVMTGGSQGRVVGLGPVNGENAEEVERLEELIDGALDRGGPD